MMDVQHEVLNPVSPGSVYGTTNMCVTEDSGYHTSFTPGSTECSELSLDSAILPTINTAVVSASNVLTTLDKSALKFNRKYTRLKNSRSTVTNENACLPSPVRRACKRPYQEDINTKDMIFKCSSTPTSFIAGGIQNLDVNERESNICLSNSFQVTSDDIYYQLHSSGECSKTFSYLTTPVKKTCKSNISLTSNTTYNHNSSPLRPINNIGYPPKKSIKRLNFTSSLHLNSETHINIKKQVKTVARGIFKPEQKIDIIAMMYSKKYNCVPVLKKILSYLSSEDIYNFNLVSSLWSMVCHDIPEAKCKIEQYTEFIENTKENSENRNTAKICEVAHIADEKSLNSLKDIYNIVEARQHHETPKSSPPGTPRTNRFKRFAKAGSLDSRLQLCCVRCGQPSKVNEEDSGEEWAECSSNTCAYKFCRFCKCDMHLGKKCFQYDLEAPSPSKRKKPTNIIGTKKSRKNLRRLL